jgi:hypothetical protein
MLLLVSGMVLGFGTASPGASWAAPTPRGTVAPRWPKSTRDFVQALRSRHRANNEALRLAVRHPQLGKRGAGKARRLSAGNALRLGKIVHWAEGLAFVAGKLTAADTMSQIGLLGLESVAFVGLRRFEDRVMRTVLGNALSGYPLYRPPLSRSALGWYRGALKREQAQLAKKRARAGTVAARNHLDREGYSSWLRLQEVEGLLAGLR